MTDRSPGDLGGNARGLPAKLAALLVLVGVADFAFGALYVTVLLRVGLTPLQIGAGFFASFLLSTAVEVPSGDWGDRWGQRRMTVAGLTCWGVSLVVFALTTATPVAMLLALGLWAVGQAVFSGAPLSLTINQIPPEPAELRHKAIRLSSIAKWVGSSAGGLLVFLGADLMDAPLLIGCAGGVLVILAVWVRLTWPESEPAPAHHAERRLVQRLRLGWSSGLGTLLVLAMIASALLSVLLFAWQPLIALAGVPVRANGLVLLLLTLLAAAGAALSRYSDRFPGPPAADVIVALFIVALLLAVAGWQLTPATTFAALGAIEVLTSYSLTVVAVRAHSLFKDRFRNLHWSLFSAAMGAAMAVSDLLLGLLWDRSGIAAALLTAGLAMAGALSVAHVVRRFIMRRGGADNRRERSHTVEEERATS